MSIFAGDYNSYEDVDLDIVEGPGGEMTLRNSTQARWDATSYGNAAGFMPPAMSPPSGLGGQGYQQPSMQPSHSNTSQYSAAPPVLPGASGPVTLRVKAPPNSYPGMQIRVQHPHTGQLHLVAIPSGVHAGFEFRVNL
jgi:hypothetical protein